jgi:hypothetical protein
MTRCSGLEVFCTLGTAMPLAASPNTLYLIVVIENASFECSLPRPISPHGVAYKH